MLERGQLPVGQLVRAGTKDVLGRAHHNKLDVRASPVCLPGMEQNGTRDFLGAIGGKPMPEGERVRQLRPVLFERFCRIACMVWNEPYIVKDSPDEASLLIHDQGPRTRINYAEQKRPQAMVEQYRRHYRTRKID